MLIPLPFLPAAALFGMGLWLSVRYPEPLRAPWLVAFLFSLALQFILIGARYGYGLDWVLSIQHPTGALIPPLAYLAFRNPKISIAVSAHLLPVVIMWATIRLASNFIDFTLALITFAYAASLILQALRGNETLSWAPLRHGRALRTGLWAAVATLVLSGATDLIVAIDLIASGGAHTGTIVAGAFFTGAALIGSGLTIFLQSRREKQSAAHSAEDRELVDRLSAELDRDQLFRDPELTLARLAGRLKVPARQISHAVNRTTGLNVSQFVNNRRIADACRMLEASDISVTNAMLDAGFFTKSNFNREFRRVTGQSPTAWRSRQKPSPAHPAEIPRSRD